MTRDAGKDVGEEQTKKLLEATDTWLATVKISVFQKQGTELPNDTAIPHIPEGRAAINMPQRYLVTVAKEWSQLRRPLTDRCMSKMWDM